MKVLSLLPLIALGGCTLYHISHDKNDKNAGIQYYDVVNIPTATLTCGEMWWELKLNTITLKDGKEIPRTFVAYTTKPEKVAEMNLIYAQTTTAQEASDKLSPLFTNLAASELLQVPPKVINVMDPASGPDPLAELSYMGWSTGVRRATGDAHYFNVRRPLIGSASATVKLAQDGTLTEASALVDDQTIPSGVAALTSLVPVADFVSSRITPAPAAVPLTEGGKSQKSQQNPANSQHVLLASYSSVAWTRTYAVTSDYAWSEEKKKWEAIKTPKSCTDLRGLADGAGSSLTINTSSSAREKAPDTTGYTISGTVIPPKAATK